MWREVAKELDSRNIIKTEIDTEVDPSLSMIAEGVGELVFIDGIMDRMVYFDILENDLPRK